MKKGQKQTETKDQQTEMETTLVDGQEENEQSEPNDDDWFKVKPDSNTLEQFEIETRETNEKKKKLTKAKLAKKLRKKNLLVNKRIEYDDQGNVS